VGKSYPSLDTLERTADALQVEMKEFFEFGHHGEEEELLAGINQMLTQTDKANLKLIFRIVRAISS
jgi:hypothetical protein